MYYLCIVEKQNRSLTCWKKNSPLAQLVEHLVYIQRVVGSSPTGTTIANTHGQCVKIVG